MASNHFHHFIENASVAQSEDITKKRNNGEFNYEIYDLPPIKTENQPSVKQNISTEQNYQFPSSEYTCKLTNYKSNEIGDSEMQRTFQKESPPCDNIHTPQILETIKFKIPNLIKQTDNYREKLDCASAFKPIYQQHHYISDKEIIRINDNGQPNMESFSAFKPVHHSIKNDKDEVKKIETTRQNMMYRSAFKPVFNSCVYAADEVKGISNSRQNRSYSSAFKPVYHFTQNNSDDIAGIDYKRIRLNENIPSNYLGKTHEDFFSYTAVQPTIQSNIGTWVDVNYNFDRQEGDVYSNKMCRKQSYINCTEKLVSNNDIAALLLRQIEAIETNNKLLKEIILTKCSASNKEN